MKSLWIFIVWSSIISSTLLASHSHSKLILIDGFTSYLSGLCKPYCESQQIDIIDLISPYTCKILQSQGKMVPTSLRAPDFGEEISWLFNLEGLNADTYCNSEGELTPEGVDLLNKLSREFAVIAESDAGVTTSERIQVALGCVGNGVSPHLSNKYLMNENAKANGLKTVKQILAYDWDSASSFLDSLWNNNELERKCVVKPYRGVASDGVYLCEGKEEALQAFSKLIHQTRYGGGVNEAVLIQEYAIGQEYAVDTVAKDGVIKVIALWRYEKEAVNDAPFVYQCSELIGCSSEEEHEVCDYCIKVLQAQGLKWGPTHTEIRYTSDGPRLMEINPRWHAQHFEPITQACLGNDAVRTTLDSYFDPEAFDALPERPPANLRCFGLILHLISYVEGVITNMRYIDEIQARPSCHLLELSYGIGDRIEKTTNIRTDSGYVLLIHPDSNVVAEDYEYIVNVQKDMFEVVNQFEYQTLTIPQSNTDEIDSIIPMPNPYEVEVNQISNVKEKLVNILLTLKNHPAVLRSIYLLGFLYFSNLFVVMLLPLLKNQLIRKMKPFPKY